MSIHTLSLFDLHEKFTAGAVTAAEIVRAYGLRIGQVESKVKAYITLAKDTAVAQAVALDVHELLAAGSVRIELSNAIVDPDKCALCLTCVRACPYDAMAVNAEKGVAESLPEVCQHCGICAGECPAKAIELPVYADTVLMARL